MMEERKAYAVWTNTDLSEGRGVEYVKFYTEKYSTAKRLAKGNYVQGADCRIAEEIFLWHDFKWYAPGPLVLEPTSDDLKQEEFFAREAEIARVVDRAKKLGLTQQEIDILLKAR
jgi:hypothetical protein